MARKHDSFAGYGFRRRHSRQLALFRRKPKPKPCPKVVEDRRAHARADDEPNACPHEKSHGEADEVLVALARADRRHGGRAAAASSDAEPDVQPYETSDVQPDAWPHKGSDDEPDKEPNKEPNNKPNGESDSTFWEDETLEKGEKIYSFCLSGGGCLNA